MGDAVMRDWLITVAARLAAAIKSEPSSAGEKNRNHAPSAFVCGRGVN